MKGALLAKKGCTKLSFLHGRGGNCPHLPPPLNPPLIKSYKVKYGDKILWLSKEREMNFAWHFFFMGCSIYLEVNWPCMNEYNFGIIGFWKTAWISFQKMPTYRSNRELVTEKGTKTLLSSTK